MRSNNQLVHLRLSIRIYRIELRARFVCRKFKTKEFLLKNVNISVVELKHDVSFEGNGYIQLPRKLLESKNNDEQLIALELSTNSTEGIVFWQGPRPNEPLGDYIGLISK